MARKKVTKTQSKVSCVEQANFPTMLQNDKENIVKKMEELQEKIKLNTAKILSGKCPIRVFEEDGKVDINSAIHRDKYSSPFDVLKHLTATQDSEIASEIMHRGVMAMPYRDNRKDNTNAVLQTLADSAPKDSIEARLCLQAAALYSQGMVCLSEAENSSMLCHREFYMRSAIKLLRLHNETVEALNKHRRGGEQRVVVQHVNVNEGGQAIVGNVHNGGGINKNNDEVLHGHIDNLQSKIETIRPAMQEFRD